MDTFWQLAAAGGVAGAVAALIGQLVGDWNEGRRQRRQQTHDEQRLAIEHAHADALQRAEREHAARLRQEESQAQAATWSVPIVAQALFWVEMKQREAEGLDVSEYVVVAEGFESLGDPASMLRSAFRLWTEHPDKSVRHDARIVYDRMLPLFGPRSADDDRHGNWHQKDQLETLRKTLEWFMPAVQPVKGDPGSESPSDAT